MNRIVPTCLVALLLVGCAKVDPSTLRVGMELSYAPFEMTDSQGKPTGVSVDLAEALAGHLGKKLVIENIPFDGLIPALKTGRIDLIISSMTVNAERAQSIDFSDPYLSTGLAILTGSQSTLKSIIDVDQPGRVVVVKKATTGHLYAIQHLKAAKLNVLDEDSSCALEVAQGKADAFLYDQMSIYQHWKKHTDTTRALLDPFQKESWAIAVRKGNEPLRQQVNAFLSDFKARGGFNELGDRHLQENKKAFAEMGYPFYF